MDCLQTVGWYFKRWYSHWVYSKPTGCFVFKSSNQSEDISYFHAAARQTGCTAHQEESPQREREVKPAGHLCDVDLCRDCDPGWVRCVCWLDDVGLLSRGGTTIVQREEGNSSQRSERDGVVWLVSVFGQWQCQSCLQCCFFINAVVLTKCKKQQILVTAKHRMQP